MPLAVLLMLALKAGDPAPAIDWTKTLHSPQSTQSHPNLAGVYTVLQFLPITANPQAIAPWNEMIAEFRDKPVQFIWIASEPPSKLEPFLKTNPVEGWVLTDESREIARSFGCDTSCANAIVDPSGNIAGFTIFLDPSQLTDVLEGKSHLKPSIEEFRPPPPAQKPDLPPSYQVHITPSKAEGTDSNVGPDFWIQRGFDLKSIASMVYEMDSSRITVAPALDNGDRFDFVLVLPKPESPETINQLVRTAIEQHFKLSAVIENKPADVYVMTALKDNLPPAKTGPESYGGGSSSSNSFEFTLPPGTPETPEAIRKAMEKMMKQPEKIGIANISSGNATIDGFRKDLEMGLGKPIVDETGLDGVYDFAVKGNAKNNEEFIRMLREQTGLVLTPATRSIPILTLR